ncbi:MAG: hypothetical protein AAGC67_06110, partial [Myxococcota bacterium]
AWGIRAWTTRAPDFAEEAGHAPIGAALDTEALRAAGPALGALFAGLGEPDEVSWFPIPQSVLDGLGAG